MKFSNYIRLSALACLMVGFTGCTDFLKEEIYTEYDPDGMLQDQSGLDALLTGAYARSRIIEYNSRNYTFLMNEFPMSLIITC